MKHLLSALALGACLSLPAAAQTLAITNGRVVTNAGPQLENATVLITNGDIVAVGANLSIPENARIIDAEGGWVTPGLFAGYTQLGLIEVALEGSTTDQNAGDSDFSVSLDVSDGFNPAGSHIPTTRMEGVTRAALFPSTGETIFGGTGALIDTAGDADSLFQTESFVFADVSQSGASTAGGSRPAAWRYLEAAFEDARGYPLRFATHPDGLVLNRMDAGALAPVVRGNRMLVLEVDREADLRRAIRFARENAPLQLVILGGAEAWKVADELAAANIPVLIDPQRNLPGSFDGLASTLANARRLHAAGVSLAYTTRTDDGYFNVRLLPQHAGNAVGNGVDWDSAFRSITLTPAEIFGVGDRYGALAPGYAADVVVWNGDPLEVMSAPVRVLIDGEIQDMSSRQTRLRDRYQNITDDTPIAYRR